MILWDKTKERFGYDESVGRSKCEIVVVCDLCGIEFVRIYSSYKQKVKKNGRFSCHSCSTKNGHFRQQCSDRAKLLWQNESYKANNLVVVKSDGYRQAKSDESKARWQNVEFRAKMMTEELRAIRKHNSSKAVKRLWKDPTYRAKLSKKISTRMVEQWKREGYKGGSIHTISVNFR